MSRISSNSSPPSWMCEYPTYKRNIEKKDKLATSFYPTQPPHHPIVPRLTSINLWPPLLRYDWHGMPNSMVLYRKGSCNGCCYGNDSQPWILMIIHGSKIENMLSSFYGAILLLNLTNRWYEYMNMITLLLKTWPAIVAILVVKNENGKSLAKRRLRKKSQQPAWAFFWSLSCCSFHWDWPCSSPSQQTCCCNSASDYQTTYVFYWYRSIIGLSHRSCFQSIIFPPPDRWSTRKNLENMGGSHTQLNRTHMKSKRLLQVVFF